MKGFLSLLPHRTRCTSSHTSHTIAFAPVCTPNYRSPHINRTNPSFIISSVKLSPPPPAAAAAISPLQRDDDTDTVVQDVEKDMKKEEDVTETLSSSNGDYPDGGWKAWRCVPRLALTGARFLAISRGADVGFSCVKQCGSRRMGNFFRLLGSGKCELLVQERE